MQINCIPLWILPGNHTQHAHAVHMLLPAPTAEPEIWCCPHRPLLSLCHKLQYGAPPNSSPVACNPSPEDSTLIWLGTMWLLGNTHRIGYQVWHTSLRGEEGEAEERGRDDREERGQGRREGESSGVLCRCCLATPCCRIH